MGRSIRRGEDSSNEVVNQLIVDAFGCIRCTEDNLDPTWGGGLTTEEEILATVEQQYKVYGVGCMGGGGMEGKVIQRMAFRAGHRLRAQRDKCDEL